MRAHGAASRGSDGAVRASEVLSERVPEVPEGRVTKIPTLFVRDETKPGHPVTEDPT